MWHKYNDHRLTDMTIGRHNLFTIVVYYKKSDIEEFGMVNRKLKHLGAIGVLSSALLFQAVHRKSRRWQPVRHWV